MIPPFKYDSKTIRFRSWTAILSLTGQIPESHTKGQAVLFLDEEAEAYLVETVTVRQSLFLRNTTGSALRNITLKCEQTNETVFQAHEIPSGRSLQMEFLREGNFTLHYALPLSSVTLQRGLRVELSAKPRSKKASPFTPSLQPALQK